MVGYAGGIEELKIKNMNELRLKYPFLEEIIAQQTYDLFSIEETLVDEFVLAEKCHHYSCEGPEASDEHFYSFSNEEVRKLARYKNPSPSVREELTYQGITPEFLVKSAHLKYEIGGQHRHDVSLTIYKS